MTASIMPEDSVHSLSYYYNWALSHCAFKYVCKWDGDMILNKEAREPFQAFLTRIQRGRKMCWIIKAGNCSEALLEKLSPSFLDDQRG